MLNGRRSPDPEVAEAIEALRGQGSTVQVELADVTDAAALDAMLARMDADLPPLAGVIHSVGVLADATIGNQTWETFETVLWPKMLGAWHLHRATADRDLDMFILFSSVAGVLGNPGQANHAAANAFLDQLAAHRRALGLPGQAIAWGAWSEIGEAEEQRERMTRRSASGGIEWITPQQGLRAFDRLVREDATTSVVLARDWVAFGECLESHPPLLEDVLSDGVDEGDDGASAEDLLSQLRQAPAATREEVLASFLQGEVKAVLRLPTSPAPTVGFFDLGMDSLMAVELRNRLNRAFAGAYTASNTVVFDYPDITALAAHLAGELAEVVGAEAPAAQPAPATDPAPSPAVRGDDGSSADAIAIVGMACRFPGAPDLPAFWQQLEAGTDAVTDERREPEPWQDFVESLPDRYGAYRRAGFVAGIDEFDARFFRISPIEARLMDPQQRMLLETTWQALEDAGIDPDGLRGSRTGVYAGVASSEYRDLMRSGDYGIGYLSTAASMAVGRVAYQFGFEGPTMPVELNCASSLIAVHQAVTGLRLGEVDLALVGGANAVLSAGITREMADLQLLSPEGRCKSFDASADGFVRGEGCGMVVLKRLAEAEADGDRIWAVIRGSAFNQNGATAGATVPNGPAQERLIEQALSQAGVAPAEVDYLEAHGAGSAFGDPIEVQSAAAVYGKGRAADRPLLMGSVKTNIGHLESAAGIAGLIKTVLAMKQGVIPRHLHFENPSTLVEWETLPVRVMTETQEWPQESGRPPWAGVSAFGISGVNAHVVMEGHGPTNGASAGVDGGKSHAGAPKRVAATLPEPVASPPPSEEAFSARNTRMLPLSAKSDEALQALAGRYLAWLDAQADELAAEGAASDTLLSDMAWTAAVGRSHFGHRAGVVFQDEASLRQSLTAHAHAEPGPSAATKVGFVYTGETDRWVSMGGALYAREPVVRAVLNRCDAALGEDRGASLLDAMFGGPGAEGGLSDPAWARPATYALACALTALWASVGIRPSVVAGHGAGEIAAAQAAGVFGLEDGLRLAAAGGDAESALEGVAIAAPSVVLVGSLTGRVMEPDQALDSTYWRRQAADHPPPLSGCAETLAGLGVDVVIEIGRDAVLAPLLAKAWPKTAEDPAAPTLLSSLQQSSGGEEEATGHADGDFVEAVARAYEAGLGVSFAGLFAGETRRRISLPGYPFQRRRFWLPKPGAQTAASD
ncbi:MAG: beta-ketoacyl synthase N-terminal-like domain-containing protein [Rhodospirillales bacterium]|nr:beta-ketoacyl synthase N-terminal-like domain-containing protein [Rhodospirillales bacterium]